MKKVEGVVEEKSADGQGEEENRLWLLSPSTIGKERGLDFDSRGEMICRDCILAG